MCEKGQMKALNVLGGRERWVKAAYKTFFRILLNELHVLQHLPSIARAHTPTNTHTRAHMHTQSASLGTPPPILPFRLHLRWLAQSVIFQSGLRDYLSR